MIRHAVMLRWKDDATAEQREAVRAGLAALPGLIPAIRSYTFGSDAGLVEGNADFLVVADFDDVDGWRTYMEHPEHVRVIAECIRPILASRTAVQLDLP